VALLAGVLALLPLGTAVSAPAAPGRLEPETAGRIDTIFADSAGVGRPGYAVGIVREGSLIYAKGFGYANLDHGIAITPATTFNVASLSKQFTAAAVALLILRGKVALQDEVRRHIAEFPQRFGPVRIEHLVYMTSGLPEYYRLQRPGGRDWQLDHFTIDDAISAVFAQRALEFKPGTEWAYSNTNYQLLARVVERASRQSLDEFLRREVFVPLEMHDTHVNDELSRVVPRRATGYNLRNGGGYQQEIRRSPHYGGSGVFSTVNDLAKWDRSLRDHRLAGPEFTRLMLSTRRFEHDKSNDAFGLVWGEIDGQRTLWYEGGDAGFSSYMVRLVDSDLSVIVLSNLGTGRAADRARTVLKVLMDQQHSAARSQHSSR
jgi:CubicO group peptidase (beta-lactamase class C family)